MGKNHRIIIGCLLWAGSSIGGLMADTVFLNPGQCVIIGNQQVCALKTDTPPQASEAKKPRYIYVCKYGKHPSSSIPELSSYSLFEVMIKEDGVKVENELKNFGANGRKNCEQEAARREQLGAVSAPVQPPATVVPSTPPVPAPAVPPVVPPAIPEAAPAANTPTEPLTEAPKS